MIKLIKILVKLIESKLVKSGIEEVILKNQNYLFVAKKIWDVVEENFRITEKVEEKLESKADQFDKLLLAKFPELSQEDVAELRQSIAGDVNKGKQAVLDSSELLKKLQDENVDLKSEVDSMKQNVSDLSSKNASLEQEKTDLQNKINAFVNQANQIVNAGQMVSAPIEQPLNPVA
jgi:chromosome segregation ATPase